MKLKSKSPFTIVETVSERYIWHKGKLMLKQWFTRNKKKAQPTKIFNHNGWPNEDM